jgi:hypothetical protein
MPGRSQAGRSKRIDSSAPTAPWSELGSAASVIRAAGLVGIIPCLGDREEQQIEEDPLLVGRLLAGEQNVEVLGEAEPAPDLCARGRGSALRRGRDPPG